MRNYFGYNLHCYFILKICCVVICCKDARTCFPMPLVGSLVVVALTARCSTFQQTKKEPLDLRLDDKTSGCLKWKFQYYCFKISVKFKKINKLEPPFT